MRSLRVDSTAAQIEGEVIGVTARVTSIPRPALFRTCPGVHNSTLTLNNGLIEVESVEVKSHG